MISICLHHAQFGLLRVYYKLMWTSSTDVASLIQKLILTDKSHLLLPILNILFLIRCKLNEALIHIWLHWVVNRVVGNGLDFSVDTIEYSTHANRCSLSKLLVSSLIPHSFNALLIMWSLSWLENSIFNRPRCNPSWLATFSLLLLVFNWRWDLLLVLNVGVRTDRLKILLHPSFVRVLLGWYLKVIVLMLLHNYWRADTVSSYTSLSRIDIWGWAWSSSFHRINRITATFQYRRSFLSVSLNNIVW
jgi:hypothetical protein